MFCSSPSRRGETLINSVSEKDIKSSSNPQAAFHMRSWIILHVQNHRKHYFLLKQIVLQKWWMLQMQRWFASPSFNLSLIWYICECITIHIYLFIFLQSSFLLWKENLKNSSTILVFLEVLKTWHWAPGSPQLMLIPGLFLMTNKQCFVCAILLQPHNC